MMCLAFMLLLARSITLHFVMLLLLRFMDAVVELFFFTYWFLVRYYIPQKIMVL